MINDIRVIDEAPACEYGAAFEEGHLLRRTCWAREHWMRRHGVGRRSTKRRGASRWPTTCLLCFAEAGVSWT
ncbi:hypothetical protein [Streptosporangium sp. NBC_01756]|uniref:hypothetical protein n=1 Tax=Streptosporangium sp. NBC_01756 TaxID=2975950 RepID=UPI002DDAC2DE|nr:hypothetical protein [Streptosporangium sp. NBC_01756]WSC89479.1 hypothetical protein OIE48_15245 [Streptosporangium sp. NBC_01756]